jgi:hypothetical protein
MSALGWTQDKPTKSGWFWYREPGLNMDQPMPVWVYEVKESVYAQLIAPRQHAFVIRNVEECRGQWSGPMDVPV